MSTEMALKYLSIRCTAQKNTVNDTGKKNTVKDSDSSPRKSCLRSRKYPF